MTFPLAHHSYTYQDYVWLEQESSTRHEFLGGEIFAMAGCTPEHAAMAAEVIGQLRDALAGGPCRVFTSDRESSKSDPRAYGVTSGVPGDTIRLA